MDNRTKKLCLAILTILLMMLLFCARLTGAVIHAVVGAALLLVLFIHIAGGWKKRKYIPRSFWLVDRLLAGCMVLLLVTGLLGHPFGDILVVKILHKLSATVFLAGCLVHLAQHRRKVRRRTNVS